MAKVPKSPNKDEEFERELGRVGLELKIVFDCFPIWTLYPEPGLRTGQPETRVNLMRQGEWWRQAKESSAAILKDGSWWDILEKSEASANVLFKLCGKVQGAIHHLLTCRYASYPYRLIDILSPDPFIRDTAIAELMTAKLCMMDLFTKDFRNTYHTAAMINTPQCRTELHLILSSLWCTTFSTERVHSTNLRRLKARRQSQAMSLEDIAITHMGVASSPVPSHCIQEAMSRKLVCPAS